MAQSGGSVFQREGMWFARLRYTDKQGRRREKKRPARTKTAADTILSRLYSEVAIERGERSTVRTFKDVGDHYRKLYVKAPEIHGNEVVAGMRSWRTIESHFHYIDARFGESFLDEITPAELERFRASLRRPQKVGTDGTKTRTLNVATVNRILATLRRVFSVAVRDGLMIASPFLRTEGLVSNSKEIARSRVLSAAEELALFHELADERRVHLWLKVVLAIETGMREGEINGLRRGDIDFENGLIRVSTTRTKARVVQPTKTDESRTVPISARLRRDLIDAHVDALAPEAFVMRSGLTTKRAWATACRNAGIAGLQFRDLRTSAGMRMLARGMEYAVVAKILGHKDTKTTYRWYTQLGTEMLDLARGVMDAPMPVTKAGEKRGERAETSLLAMDVKGEVN